MTGKRGNNEGSITQRADGRWMYRWTDHTGKRRTAYAKTRKEAATKLREALTYTDAGVASHQARDSFTAVFETWLTVSGVRQGIGSRTVKKYEGYLRKHAIPIIGSMPIKDVRQSDIAKVMVAMEKGGLSTASRQGVRNGISDVFKLAVADELIRTNPARGLNIKQEAAREVVVPDRSQVVAMVENSKGAHRAYVAVLANTGLRFSEAQNLRWSDLKGNSLIVRRGKGGKPRAVPVTNGLAAELKRWRIEQTAQRLAAARWDANGDWIFTNEAGQQLSENSIRRRFKPVADAHCPGLTPHGLRHACATLLMEEGVPMKVVSDVLGHATIKVTASTYSHVTARLLDDARDAIDRALGGA